MRALALSLSAASAVALAGTSPLAPIKSPAFEPCMCELYLGDAREAVVFLSDTSRKAAVLNINGTDTKLQAETVDTQSGYYVEGQIYKSTYRQGNAGITVLMTAGAFQGPEGGGILEGHPMKAEITYVSGEKKQTLRANGSCGCVSHSNNVFQPTNSRCARIRG